MRKTIKLYWSIGFKRMTFIGAKKVQSCVLFAVDGSFAFVLGSAMVTACSVVAGIV